MTTAEDEVAIALSGGPWGWWLNLLAVTLGLVTLAGAIMMPALWSLLLLNGPFAVFGAMDLARQSEIRMDDHGFRFEGPWKHVYSAGAWRDLADVRLEDTALRFFWHDKPMTTMHVIWLAPEARQQLVSEIRARIGADTPMDRLAGVSTVDGLVVPLAEKPAQPLWSVLMAVFVLAMGSGLGAAALLGPFLGLFLGLCFLGAVGFGAAALGSGKVTHAFRLGDRDVSVLVDDKVVWRKPLFQVASAHIGLGSTLVLKLIDGTTKRLPFAHIPGDVDSGELLAAAIDNMASEARAAPDAVPVRDARLDAMLRASQRRSEG